MLTVGSLCSGYGGIELALASVLDCDLAWFAEFEDAPATIMAHHHPGVPNLRDLTKVDWSTVEPVDVLSAGFPCQPFSHAGKRLGANDERHLWPYIAQAIDLLRPRLALLENVRGLLTAQGEPDPEWVAELARKAARWQVVIHHVIEPKIRKARRRGQLDRITRLEADVVRLLEQRRVALDTVRRARSRLVRAIGVVVRDLANLGYDCRWYGLRAADVGAAHGRFRVFLFATPADSGGFQGGWDSGAASRAEASKHGSSRTDLHESGPADRGVGYDDGLTLLPTPQTSDTNGPGEHGTGGPDLRTAVSLLPTPRATDGTKGGPNQWGQYAAAIARAEQAIGRPAPPPTEPGPKGAQRLSPRFVEWLMMLPEGWVTDVSGLSRNELLKMLGNGVVVPQCAAALRAFLWDAYGIGAAA